MEKMKDDVIYRQDAIDAVHKAGITEYDEKLTIEEIKRVTSAQLERIQNNAVHLCDSCQYTYMTCPSYDNDAIFGKGNDNICACNKYNPSAQPERKKGEWVWITGDIYTCSECGTTTHVDECMEQPMYKYCPYCNADMRGEQDETD